nr:uncharacterized protein LOC118681553 isoform X2 [Bactrocera oleae]
MTYIGYQICLQSVEETGTPYYTSHLRTPPHSVTTRRHVIPPSNKTDGSHIRGSTFVCTQCRVNTTFNIARFLHSLAQFDS